MFQLILKTLVRVLLIFLPVAIISFSRDSSPGQSGPWLLYSVVIVGILGLGVVVWLVLWAIRRSSSSKKPMSRTDTQSTASQNH